MTLNSHQKELARRELGELLERSGLAVDDLVRDLGFTRSRAKGAISLDPSCDPADAWAVRDYLLRAMRERGEGDVDLRVFTDSNRVKAQRWFPLVDPPAVGSGAGPRA